MIQGILKYSITSSILTLLLFNDALANECNNPLPSVMSFQAHFVGTGNATDVDDSQKSEYEGNLLVSAFQSSIFGNLDYSVGDGALNNHRIVARQDLQFPAGSPNLAYRPLFTPFQQTTELPIPNGPYGNSKYVIHSMSNHATNPILVGYDGEIIVPPATEFGLRGFDDPFTGTGRAYYWKKNNGAWEGHAIPLPSINYQSEALDITTNSQIIIGYQRDFNVTLQKPTARAFKIGASSSFQTILTGIAANSESIAFAINENHNVIGALGDILSFPFHQGRDPQNGLDATASGFICKINPTTLLCESTESTLLNHSLSTGNANFDYTCPIGRVLPKAINDRDYTVGAFPTAVGTLQPGHQSYCALTTSDFMTPTSRGFVCQVDANGHCNNTFVLHPEHFPNISCDESDFGASVDCRTDIYAVNNGGVFVGFAETNFNGESIGVVGRQACGNTVVADINTLSISGLQGYKVTRALDINASNNILVELRNITNGQKKVAILVPNTSSGGGCSFNNETNSPVLLKRNVCALESDFNATKL